MRYPAGHRLTRVPATQAGRPHPDEDGVTEMWDEVHGRPFHLYVATPAGPTTRPGGVVLLPGLGLPAYTFKVAAALAAFGLRCTVLDLPGFGSVKRDTTRSHVHAIGHAAAQWVLSRPADETSVLVGHSTGSQAALTAALGLQHVRADLALVLAGPTFTPRQRRFLPLATATVTAYRRDSLGDLVVVPALARGRSRVVSMLRSGMRDAPDRRVARLTLPLTLTAGEADSYAPQWWLERMRESAVLAPDVDIEVLPGSHNNLYAYPEEFAAVVSRVASRPRLPVSSDG